MRLFKSSRGGISVFLCMIFLAVLLVVGILIDAARIMTAERKIQSSLNTAVRSTLAGYDTDLVGGYGIFGVDGGSKESKLKEDFLSYLKFNLTDKSESLGLVKYYINREETSVQAIGNLVDDKSIKSEIMKYMKYKAPITATQNIVEKFKASGIFQKLNFSRTEKEVRKHRKELTDKIDSANTSIKDINKARQKSLNDLNELKTSIDSAGNHFDSISGILSQYQSAKKQSDETALSSGIQASGNEFSGILDKSLDIKSKLDTYSKDIKAAIDRMQPMTSELDSLKSQAGKLELEIAGLSKKSDEVDTPDKEYEGAKSELEKKENALAQLKEEISSKSKQLQDALDGFSYQTLDEIDIQDTNRTISRLDDADAKNKADSLVSDIFGKYSEYLNNIEPNWLITQEDINRGKIQSEEKFDKMRLQSASQIELPKEAEEKNDNVLSFMMDLKGAFDTAVQDGMEKIYITEYIMDRFAYVTSKTERGHYFEKGEVEYILWGNNNQLDNIIKTNTSVWFLRFAIDTIDSFAVSKLPHPVLRLVESLGKGFIQACKDVYELYNGKEINLSPSLKQAININYADHLRVFLILQPESKLLNNIKQLIQVNIKQSNDKFELKNYGTVLYGKAEVGVNLWFLPLLKLDMAKVPGFEDGKYVIRKEIYMSY